MKKTIFLAVAIFSVVFALSSCSKNDGPKSGGTHKVQFKATGSSGVNISVVGYALGTEITTKSDLSGNTWTSEEFTTSAGTLNCTVNAIGVDANSTLKVEIIVDGAVKKTSTSTGSVLSATVAYGFD